MTPADVDDVLAELSTALDNREFDTANDRLTELESEYDFTSGGSDNTGSTAQPALQTRAVRDGAAVVDPEDAITLDSFWMTNATTQMTRSLVVILTAAIVADHDEMAASGELDALIERAQAGIADLRDAEETLSNQRTEAETITTNHTIPPVLDVSVPTPTTTVTPNQSTELTVSVRNTGDEPAEDVTLSVRPSDAVSVSKETMELELLASGDAATISFSVQPTTTGVHTVQVGATASEASDSTEMVTISATDQGDEQDDPDQGSDDGTGDGRSTGDSNGVIFGLSAPETGIGGAVVAGLAYAGFRAYRSHEDEQNGQPLSGRDDQQPGSAIDSSGGQQHQRGQTQQQQPRNIQQQRRDQQDVNHATQSGQQSDQQSSGWRGQQSVGQSGTERRQRDSDQGGDGGRDGHTSRCSHCGRSVEAGDTVCSFCEKPLGDQTGTEDNSSPESGHASRCPNCGRSVEAGDTVCGFCDEPLRG